MKLQDGWDDFKWTLLRLKSPEVKRLHVTLSRRKMCMRNVTWFIKNFHTAPLPICSMGKTLTLCYNIYYQSHSLPDQMIPSQLRNLFRIGRSISPLDLQYNHDWHRHTHHCKHVRWPCLFYARFRLLVPLVQPFAFSWRSTPENIIKQSLQMTGLTRTVFPKH